MKTIKLGNKELEEFLREEKAFTKFIKNATTKRIGGLGRAPLMESYTLQISESFQWSSSLEGFDFWIELEKKFKLNRI